MADHLEITNEHAPENRCHCCPHPWMPVSYLLIAGVSILIRCSTIAASAAKTAEFYIAGNHISAGSEDITCKNIAARASGHRSR